MLRASAPSFAATIAGIADAPSALTRQPRRVILIGLRRSYAKGPPQKSNFWPKSSDDPSIGSTGRREIYAIVRTGGKQYKVAVGEAIEVEQLPAEEGDTVELDDVLLIADGEKVAVGTPTVEGAKVKATVVGQGKGKKVTVFKYKPKVRYRRKIGHRQPYTKLAIREILW